MIATASTEKFGIDSPDRACPASAATASFGACCAARRLGARAGEVRLETARERNGFILYRMGLRLAAFVLLTVCVAGAGADDKSEYDRRAAASYMALFQSLDRNGDKVVTKLESHGDLNFGPRFDDMDINRDGVVTLAELQHFIEREHGTNALVGQR